jgi:hypothetical protein
MRKMDDLGNPKNHGHPHGQEAVYEPEYGPVDDLLKKHFSWGSRKEKRRAVCLNY